MNRMVRFLKGLSALIYPNHCFFCGDTVSSGRVRMCDACLKRFGETGTCRAFVKEGKTKVAVRLEKLFHFFDRFKQKTL